ncbi:hypothetical protein LCGC14_2928490 [marine sediment metagenome]|uniref:Uncharacterized protein n=1 Tax=marine sediment metagenome TaxID=412755 RepID=A0A0F9ACR1_9ZZZZ
MADQDVAFLKGPCPRVPEFFNDLRGAGLHNPRSSTLVDRCYADCPTCDGSGEIEQEGEVK